MGNPAFGADGDTIAGKCEIEARRIASTWFLSGVTAFRYAQIKRSGRKRQKIEPGSCARMVAPTALSNTTSHGVVCHM